jgi:hypothetical protein
VATRVDCGHAGITERSAAGEQKLRCAALVEVYARTRHADRKRQRPGAALAPQHVKPLLDPERAIHVPLA